MGILGDQQMTRLKVDFEKALINPVTLTVFTQEVECDYCKETRELAQEISTLNDKIKIQVFDLLNDAEEAAVYQVDKVPALVIESSKKTNVKFYGVPAGYEFNTLVKDIIQISREENSLSPETKKILSNIKKPVHLRVFVTPTCPHCPGMVSLAHQFAMENANIAAEMIEVSEFPQLGIKYNVVGVPKTVVNESIEIVGLQSEREFATQVEAATRSLPTLYG